MRHSCALKAIVGLGVSVWVLCPSVAVADYYDGFYDGQYTATPTNNDPNLWQCDSPHWTTHELIGQNQTFQIVSDSVVDNGFWVYADAPNPPFDYAAVAAVSVSSDDDDPNTSATWWDDTMDHYVVAWVYYPGYYDRQDADPNKRFSFNDPNYDPNYDDPDDDKGEAMILMHADLGNWSGFVYKRMFSVYRIGPGYHESSLRSFAFWRQNQDPWNRPEWPFRQACIDPNDPNWALYPNQPYGCPLLMPFNEAENPYNGPDYGGQNLDDWDRSGTWMAFQFQRDPNYETGDPNGKFLRGTIWHGGKFDWDGKWLVEGELSGVWKMPQGDPNGDWYWPEGQVALVSSSDTNVGNGFPTQCVFDNIEVRTGIFTNVGRKLTLKLMDCCDLDVCPDLLDDPNHDPNNFNELRRYTNGTGIVLSTVVPCGNKVFKKWTIKGPNDSGDPLYQVVTDTNEVLYLTMDGDYIVKASCKCGGGGIEPFPGLVLLVLGLGVLIRRVT